MKPVELNFSNRHLIEKIQENKLEEEEEVEIGSKPTVEVLEE